MLDYRDLTKSPEEIAEEDAQKRAKLIDFEVDKLQRQAWLTNPVTSLVVKSLEFQLEELQKQFVSGRTQSLQALQIEAETLNKTLNQIKYGRYTNTHYHTTSE